MIDQTLNRNQFLNSLSDEDFAHAAYCLERVEISCHETLIESGNSIKHVWFPQSGLLSVLAGKGERVEVGLVGSEGMALPVFRHNERSALTVMALTQGEAWRMRSQDFVQQLLLRPSLMQAALRFQQWMAAQTSCTALSHATEIIPQRLARWLLSAHDRLRSDHIPLAHHLLSSLLAVRRSGVTESLHMLEHLGAIKTARARISIIDRQILESFAGESYRQAVEAFASAMDADDGRAGSFAMRSGAYS